MWVEIEGCKVGGRGGDRGQGWLVGMNNGREWGVDSVRWWVRRLCRFVGLVVVGTAAVMYLYFWGFGVFHAERILFQPPFASYEDSGEILKIPVDEGEALSARWMPGAPAGYVVFHHHGNAEDLGFLEASLREFVNRGYSVFAYDYRGYGTSQGHPSEGNAYEDAEAAYRYLVDELGVTPERILVHGRSLGAGLAVRIAQQHGVAGLVVESAFVSAFRVVTRIPLFLGDKFPNLSRVGSVKCPVLVLHGTADETVPVWHGRALYARAPDPKRATWIEGAGHDDLSFVGGEAYWTSWADFAGLCERAQAPSVERP